MSVNEASLPVFNFHDYQQLSRFKKSEKDIENMLSFSSDKRDRSSSAMRSYSFNGNISESDIKASTFSFFFVLSSACVLALAIYINSFVPEPLSTQEENLSSRKCLLGKFDARRVYKNLKTLTSFGPRTPGTYENEVSAVNFLIENIKEIQNETEAFANEIDYDVQTSSGCYTLGKTCKCYHRIQNVVAKLKPKNENRSETLLVNSHFDSVSSSPGASDDGLHCAVMLEMLRVLATKDEPLKKNIIFLFNGAEEDGLLGSHAFITEHKWASDIICFINLEACGAGGREILFQTGPKADILPKIYAESVPYPHGNVIGEEIFQSGALPSDTDFRIFRDYGHLKGLDFAHYKNGYVYHTSSDNISFVSTSVIQHSGKNILTLIQSLVDREDLKTQLEEHDEQVVFFDILGKFMVCYSMVTAFRINITVIILSVTMSTLINIKIFKKRKVKSLSYHYMMNFMFLGFGIFLVAIVAYGLAGLLKFCGLTMLWYAQPWFAIAYYGIPALFTITSVVKFRRSHFYSTITPEEEILIFLAISQMILTFFLLAATLLEIRSSYLLVIKLVPLCLSFLINYTVFRNEKVGKRINVHLICNFVSFFYLTYLAVPLFQLLIPMTGRMGAVADTELKICVLCQFVVLGLFLFFIPLVLLVHNFWKIQVIVAIAYIGFVIVVLFGSILKPFSEYAPERFEILHVHRKLFHPGDHSKMESSGFFLVAVDPRAPQTVNTVFRDIQFEPVNKFCAKELFCGVPLTKQSLPRNNFEYSFWHPAPEPKFPGTKNIHFTSEEETVGTRTFYFNISGPPLSQFIVQPLNESKLIEWSLESSKPKSSVTWLDEKVFLINYVRGLEEIENTTWIFWLKFDIVKTIPQSPVFKLAWSAHYRSNNTTHYDPAFHEVLEQFPKWTRVTSWVTELEEYVF